MKEKKMKDIFMKEKRVYFKEYCNCVVLVLKTIQRSVEISKKDHRDLKNKQEKGDFSKLKQNSEMNKWYYRDSILHDECAILPSQSRCSKDVCCLSTFFCFSNLFFIFIFSKKIFFYFSLNYKTQNNLHNEQKN